MPYTKETARALVSAFNVNNYFSNIVETNFTLQNRGEKDYIVVSFDGNMDHYQCIKYLSNIKRKIISEFYDVKEKDTDEVVLNTANLIFDVNSFPLDINKGEWSKKQGKIEFATPIDQGVIFNLKSHLASSLKKDVIEDMPVCRVVTKTFNKKDYLWQGKFPSGELCNRFANMFLSRMKERYENVPNRLLKVKDNDVYIRNAFDDVYFIDSITRYATWLIGMDLGVSNSVDYKVMLFKNMIIESIYKLTDVAINGFMCASPLDRKEPSVLIPIIRNDTGAKLLTHKEALKLNYVFDGNVLNDFIGRTQAELLINGEDGIYCIDFSNPDISHCVITKIIENSVINKDHRLMIDSTPFTELSHTRLESSRQGLERGAGMLSQAAELHHTVNSSERSQQSSSTAAVGANKPVQGAGGGFSASLTPDKSSDEYSKVESEEDRAKSESPKRHGVLCKVKSFFSSKSDQADEDFERYDIRRGSTQSAPVPRVSKKPSVSKQRSFPGRRKAWSNPPSEVSSPAHLKDTLWQLPEVIVESAPPVEDKSQQLKPKASVSRNGSDRSNDSGFESAEPSPRSSLTLDAANLIQQPDISKSGRFPGKPFLSEPSTSSSVLRGTSKHSPNSSDEDEFFRNHVEYVLSRRSKLPTDSSSSKTSSETVVEHNTENKGAFRKDSPSSQMDLVQLLSSRPSPEHLTFLRQLEHQRARDKSQIDRIRSLGEFGVFETRGGVHSKFS